jgi:hypothetical protein
LFFAVVREIDCHLGCSFTDEFQDQIGQIKLKDQLYAVNSADFIVENTIGQGKVLQGDMSSFDLMPNHTGQFGVVKGIIHKETSTPLAMKVL